MIRPRTRLALSVLLALLACACSSTPTPEHFTRLWVEGRTGQPLIGTSTEDGVVVLAQPDWKVGDLFEIQFPVGNSLVVDKGRIDRLNDTLAVIRPLTARLREGRFAAELPVPGEELYVALRNERDKPELEPAPSWLDGAYGDWVVLPDRDPERIARDYAGTGVYVQRGGRWELVGVLAGLMAHDESDPQGPVALGFVGLIELARILPDRLDYFARDLRPLRPDFEFGVPLQPGDIVYEPVDEAAQGEATPPKAPAAPTPGATTPKAPAKPKPKPQPKPGAPRAQH
ncbi:MAG: hypothetical protein FJ296_10390 [Planctomycetes bacterium]|nr:hypothetical protein [Planctomycetota bacterium]